MAIIVIHRMLIFACKIVGAERWSALKILIHLYSVNCVGEPCRLSKNPSIRGEFYLPISHFPLTHLYSVNGVSDPWSVVGVFFQNTHL